MAARWNESFDLILFTSRFVHECLDGLKYAIAEGTLKESSSEEMIEFITDDFVEHLTNLIFGLDKLKFSRVETA